MNGLVYLAGPMSGLLPNEATDWRKWAAWELKRVDVRCLSPMRDTDLLDQDEAIKPSSYSDPSLCDRAALTRDLSDIRRCDVLLVNFSDAKYKSLGTAWEIGAARALDKPIVVAWNPIHDHALLNASAGYTVLSLAEAVDCVKSVLGV